MKNVELSYQAHSNNLLRVKDEIEERLFPIKNNDCIGYQIIKRTLDILLPFLNDKSSWLTIGDLHGLEANYLLNHDQNAVASDISDLVLREASKEGLIKEFRTINVEKIDSPDDSFDYVICREAYHHFPKAYVGLHEMIRCSKKATIIIEPIDILAKMPLLLFTKNIMDRINPQLINKFWRNRFSFEPVGNYVYKISEREIEKIAMGMGLPCIAFKRINFLLDLKIDKSIVNKVPMDMRNWKKIQKRTRFLDLLGYLRIIPFNHLCCVIFKTDPGEETVKRMKDSGYVILNLPDNPYLKGMANKAHPERNDTQ